MPFLFIGFQETMVILLIAILVFGPKKIPEIARGLGQGIRAMRDATDDIKREIMDAAEDAREANPTKEITSVQKDVESEIQQAKKDLEDTIGPVKRDF